MYNDSENKQPWTYETETTFTPEPPPAPKREKRPFSAGKVVALALVCALLGGILGSVGGVLATKAIPSLGKNSSTIYEGERETTVLDVNTIDTGKLMTVAEVYAANVNSTVGITTSVTTNFWGYQTTSAAAGSGFVLSSDGYILTNQHVIEGSESITVSFYDGSSKPAQLIGYDTSNDIAVLKVDATDLTPVVLGDSDNMNVGDTVAAIGNPLGELTFSLTNGVVSALDRRVTTSTGVTMNLIQTDCAINSGNSGGALFNLYGEVIGITNAKYSNNGSTEASIDAIGFAIPVNSIKKLVTDIMEKGYASTPYIGITVSDVSSGIQGAAVQSVIEDGPAAKAGLQAGDIITHVNDTVITDRSHLVSIVKDSEPGDVLKVKAYRIQESLTLDLEITVAENVQTASTQEQTGQQENTQEFPNIFEGFNGFGNFGGFDY